MKTKKIILAVLALACIFVSLLSFGINAYAQDNPAYQGEYVLQSDEIMENLEVGKTTDIVAKGFTYSDKNGYFGKAVSSTITVTFTGTGIDFWGEFASDKGMFSIEIDDEKYCVGSAYANPSYYGRMAIVNGLEQKQHKAVLTILAERSVDARDSWIQVRKISVIRKIELTETAVSDNTIPENTQSVSKDINANNITTNGFEKQSDILCSNENGSSIKYAFRGEAFQIHANKGNDFGVIKLVVDNEFIGVIDCYSSTNESGIIFSSGCLAYGVHKIEIVVLSQKNSLSLGGQVQISGFTVYKRAEIDEENLSIGYDDIVVDDTFVLPSNLEYVSQDFNSTDNIISSGFNYTTANGYNNKKAGSSLTILFKGQGVELYSVFGRDKGRVDVFLDGNKFGSFSTYAPAEKREKCLLITNLNYENHILKLVIADEKNELSNDSWVCIYDIKYIQTIDANDRIFDSVTPNDTNGVSKSFSTSNLTLNGFVFNNINILSDTIGDTAKFKFRGSALWIYANVGSEKSKFSVYIDGVDYGVVNTYSSESNSNVAVFGSGILKDGLHTVVIENKKASVLSSGTNLEIVGYKGFCYENEDIDDILVGKYDLQVNNDFIVENGYDYQEIKQSNIKLNQFNLSNGNITSSTIGASVSTIFRGVGLLVYGNFSSDGGRALVQLDGEVYGEFSLYAETNRNDKCLLIYGLEHKTHSVSITILDDSNDASTGHKVSFGKFYNINTEDDSLTLTVIDSTSSIIKNDKMSESKNDIFYGGSVLFSGKVGAWIMLTFKGSDITAYGNLSSDGAVCNVYLDGSFMCSVNTKIKSGSQNQAFWFSFGDLDKEKNHTVVIINEMIKTETSKDAYLSFDYFAIANYAPKSIDTTIVPIIEIDENELSTIFVEPDKNVFYEGQSSKPIIANGGYIVQYKNGVREWFDVKENELNYSNVDFNKEGSYICCANFNGYEFKFNVEIKKDKIIEMTLKQEINKKNYNVGDLLDLTGGKVELSYESGKKETIELTDDSFTALGFDSFTDEREQVIYIYSSDYGTPLEMSIYYNVDEQDDNQGCNNSIELSRFSLYIVLIILPVIVYKKRKIKE